MNKALKLINNESKNLIAKSIKPLLSCDDTKLNICPYDDNSHCTAAVDYCYTEDHAGCIGGSVDICSIQDNSACMEKHYDYCDTDMTY